MYTLQGMAQHGALPVAKRSATKAVSSRLVSTRVALADAPSTSRKVELSGDLRNSVAVLDATNTKGETTQVYVIGVSHVSKKACDQVKELIRSVQPEVVMVELCRDRLGLLVSNDLVTQAAGLWHCRNVIFDGLPDQEKTPYFPTAAQLKPLLLAQPGRPVSTQDIEKDCFTLLSTGLFKSVRPMCKNPSVDDAPEFGVTFSPEDGGAVVRCIPPLGCIAYVCVERVLPPIATCSVRVDSSLRSFPVDQFALDAVCAAAVADSRAGVPTLAALLRAKAEFGAAFFGPITVAYNGVESGKVEAILKAPKAADAAFVSGFEASAVGGEGWGIELFRPNRPMHKISDKLFLTAELLDKMRADSRGPAGSTPASQAAADLAKQRDANIKISSDFRGWSADEVSSARRPDTGDRSAFNDFVRFAMTSLYSKAQMTAGRKTGIEKGAAWQAALQAASEVGAQQFILSDRPIDVTDKRLGETVAAESGVRLLGSLALFLGAAIGAAVLDYPQQVELGALAAAAAAALGVSWPVVGPYLEISKLADMNGAEIEERLTPKAPITSDLSRPAKLYGEDALLDWPQALGPLIEDRDEYMAKATAAAAQGSGFSPAYVLDRADGQLVWRYMQAEGAPAEASPAGFGDGAYKPLAAPRAIVNVVGTAHVPGMVRRWREALAAPTDVLALLRDPNYKPPAPAAAPEEGAEAKAEEGAEAKAEAPAESK